MKIISLKQKKKNYYKIRKSSIADVFASVFSLSDHELVWKYVDWVLTKDPEAGVQVMTALWSPD